MTSKMQVVQNNVVMLRYCLMFTSTQKIIIFFRDDNRQTVFQTSFISTYFYVLKKIVFPDEFQVDCWTPKLAHTSLIYFCRISCMIPLTTSFSFPKVTKFFFAKQWNIFVGNCFTHETERQFRNIKMNRYKFAISNKSSMKTNVKRHSNKQITNNRYQFLENIVIRDEKSENKSNG